MKLYTFVSFQFRARSPAKIAGFATRNQNSRESGWASTPDKVKNNHVLCGAATRTETDDGVISGWIPIPSGYESPADSEVCVDNAVSRRKGRRQKRKQKL